MATRRTAAAPPLEPEPELKVARVDLEAQLAERMKMGAELRDRAIESATSLDDARRAYRTWDEYNTTLLRRSFTTTKPADEYSNDVGIYFGGKLPLAREVEDFRDDVVTRLRRLESLVGQLPLYESANTPAASAGKKSPPEGTGVFIVHGRDDGLKQHAARALHKLTGEDPTILHEQPNLGRTVIEKFEEYAGRMGFAVVLLTGDDLGGLQDGPQHPRARQNVVFELGYFIGKLGRGRVAVLYEPGVELPSDVNGVLYIEVDGGGGWRYQLGRELRAAGIDADLNELG